MATNKDATTAGPPVEREDLRQAIQDQYSAVATDPSQGFHFHTGRPLAAMLGYEEQWYAGIPDVAVESFTGTGNPFLGGALSAGEWVVDVGSGAGFDSMIAARMVGPEGRVIGVDMTPAMLSKAQSSASALDLSHLTFSEGYAETLPLDDAWADMVISNGVLNLTPDKGATLREWGRVLKPGGRLQVGDILVERAVPESAKEDIALWTG